MKKIYLIVLFVSVFGNLYSQTLNWAYSLKNTVIQEGITDISSNENNRFVLLGFTDPNSVSLDFIGQKTEFKTPGKYISVYNEKSEIQWFRQVVANPMGIKMNAKSEVFVTGSYSGNIDFDPSEITFNLNSGNVLSTFLQKFDANGNLIWAVGATTQGIGTEIEEMPDGRIIVSGRSDVSSTVTLNNNTIVNLQKGIFILEISPEGKLTNAYGIEVPDAASYGYVLDLVSDANNNLFICGQLDGIADFDIGSGVTKNIKTRAYDAYIAKYDSKLALKWYKVFGDTQVAPFGWDIAHSLVVDASGNLFVSGEFTWNTDFDPVANPGKSMIVSDTRTQTPSGFIMQYTADGKLNWVKKIGAPNMDTGIFGENRIRGIRLYQNTIITLIETSKNCDVDPSEKEVKYNSDGATSLIFAAYSTQGDYINSFQLNKSSTHLTSVGIDLLGNGSFVSSGTFQSETNFDPVGGSRLLKIDPSGFMPAFDKDVYVASYNFGIKTAVNRNQPESNIEVFPNPFVNEIFYKNIASGEIEQLNIYSITGQRVLSKSLPGNHVYFTNAKSGTYILEFLKNDKTIHRSTIVKY